MLLLTPRSLKSLADSHNLAHMSIKGPFITKNNLKITAQYTI